MRTLQWVLTLLNLAAASCAWWAAITASSTLKALRQKLAERATRSLRALDVEMAELTSSVSSLSSTMRRISSRIGMQDVRARRKAESTLDPTQPLTKAELRRALQTGQLRVLRDGEAVGPAEATGANRRRNINGSDS